MLHTQESSFIDKKAVPWLRANECLAAVQSLKDLWHVMVWVRAISFGEVLESVFQIPFMEKDKLNQLRDLVCLSTLKFPDYAVGAKLSVAMKSGSSFHPRTFTLV